MDKNLSPSVEPWQQKTSWVLFTVMWPAPRLLVRLTSPLLPTSSSECITDCSPSRESRGLWHSPCVLVSSLTETLWNRLFHPLTRPLCLLSFDPHSEIPSPKQKSCLPLLLCLFPSEPVCCCFPSLFSLLPLLLCLSSVPLCKLSPTDLGLKAWHETWLA